VIDPYQHRIHIAQTQGDRTAQANLGAVENMLHLFSLHLRQS
jgi:hypothetical protein